MSSKRLYSGYMEFPAIGAETFEEFTNSCRYYGDFANGKKRFQIFKKPRKFKVSIWLKKTSGSFDVTNISLPNDTLNKEQLAELIQSIAVDEIKNYIGIDNTVLEESFIKVIL